MAERRVSRFTCDGCNLTAETDRAARIDIDLPAPPIPAVISPWVRVAHLRSTMRTLTANNEGLIFCSFACAIEKAPALLAKEREEEAAAEKEAEEGGGLIGLLLRRDCGDPTCTLHGSATPAPPTEPGGPKH